MGKVIRLPDRKRAEYSHTNRYLKSILLKIFENIYESPPEFCGYESIEKKLQCYINLPIENMKSEVDAATSQDIFNLYVKIIENIYSKLEPYYEYDTKTKLVFKIPSYSGERIKFWMYNASEFYVLLHPGVIETIAKKLKIRPLYKRFENKRKEAVKDNLKMIYYFLCKEA